MLIQWAHLVNNDHDVIVLNWCHLIIHDHHVFISEILAARADHKIFDLSMIAC